MALAVLTIACMLFYASSKYFPFQDIPIVTKRKIGSIGLASAISLLSLLLFTRSLGFATALMVWMTAFMALLSAIILSVKMNRKWIWVWGVLSVLFILIDLS